MGQLPNIIEPSNTDGVIMMARNKLVDMIGKLSEEQVERLSGIAMEYLDLNTKIEDTAPKSCPCCGQPTPTSSSADSPDGSSGISARAMLHRYRGVSSKYLNRYLALFTALEQAGRSVFHPEIDSVRQMLARVNAVRRIRKLSTEAVLAF